MNILNGKETSVKLNELLREEINVLTNNQRSPKLAVILVGSHPASLSYIKGKMKAASLVGIETELFQLGNDATDDDDDSDSESEEQEEE